MADTTIDVLIKLGTSLVGTFVGALLAFFFQRKKSKIETLEEEKDALIKFYREVMVNFELCATFKSTFLSDFNYGTYYLEHVLGEMIDADSQRLEELREAWKVFVRPVFINRLLNPIYFASQSLQTYWEKLALLEISAADIYFVARKTPDILRMVAYMQSTYNILQFQEKVRDDLAQNLLQFAGKRDAVDKPEMSFAETLFKLLRARHSLEEAINRLMAMQFATLALCEDHYYRVYGDLDFSTIRLDQGILPLMRPILDYSSFIGTEKSIHAVKEKWDHEILRNMGRKELIYKTSRTPQRANRLR